MVNLTVSVYRIKDKLCVFHKPTIQICYRLTLTVTVASIRCHLCLTGIALPGYAYFKASSTLKETIIL